jgi:3-oxoacyl-[acyl-carrier-protein] synthase II
MSKRVVVTGMGVVTPCGIGVDDYWDSISNGRGGIEKVTAFDEPALASQVVGAIPEFEGTRFMDPKSARRMSRFILFAVEAVGEALEDSGLKEDGIDRDRFGVYIGSGIGGLSVIEEQHKILMEKGPRRVNLFMIPSMIADMAAGQVSITFNCRGPNACITTACASASHSIGEAFKTIQRGAADAMIAGGSEATVTPLCFAGFCALKALSTRNDDPAHASRPFDKDRDGFVIAEGSGVMVLEELEHAKARGANIYGELLGYGLSADGYHITAPPPDGNGAARAMTMALNDAGVTPAQIDYINAHGTSTQLNEKTETAAVKKAFGQEAYNTVLASTKSMTGHLLGAAGGIEAVACMKALQEDTIPPTINYETPDPECDLDCAPNTAREQKLNYVMSNSFGFGGHNAVLIFEKFTD